MATSFEILAEIAIGVAGFGSIAIVLGQNRADWQSAELFRTAALLMSSLGALLFALLPIGLATSDLAPELIWRVSSGALAAYLVVYTVTIAILRRRHLDPELWLGPVLLSIVGITTLANLCFQVVNALGNPIPPNETSYFFGVSWLIAYGSLMLVRIVFVRPQRP